MRETTIVASRTRGVARVAVLAMAMSAGLCLARPVRAADLKAAGVWIAFRTETSDGIPICGVYTEFPDKRSFYVKWFKGNDHLTAQAFKDGWEISPNVQPKVTLTFPKSEPWNATSTSSDVTSSKVEFNIPKAVVKEFMKDFTTSANGVLTFPGGSEPGWTIDLSGTKETVEVMAQCMEEVAGPAAAAETPLAYMRRPAPAFGPQPGTGTTPPPPRSTQPF